MAQEYREFKANVRSILARYFIFSSEELYQLEKQCQEAGLDELAEQVHFKASLRHEEEEKKRIKEEKRKNQQAEKQLSLEQRQAAFDSLLSKGLAKGSTVMFTYKNKGQEPILGEVTGIGQSSLVINIRRKEKPKYHFAADPRNITLV